MWIYIFPYLLVWVWHFWFLRLIDFLSSFIANVIAILSDDMHQCVFSLLLFWNDTHILIWSISLKRILNCKRVEIGYYTCVYIVIGSEYLYIWWSQKKTLLVPPWQSIWKTFSSGKIINCEIARICSWWWRRTTTTISVVLLYCARYWGAAVLPQL